MSLCKFSLFLYLSSRTFGPNVGGTSMSMSMSWRCWHSASPPTTCISPIFATPHVLYVHLFKLMIQRSHKRNYPRHHTSLAKYHNCLQIEIMAMASQKSYMLESTRNHPSYLGVVASENCPGHRHHAIEHYHTRSARAQKLK